MPHSGAESNRGVGHWDMLARLRRLFAPAPPAVDPQLDEAVSRKLAAEGRDPQATRREPASPRSIPDKPPLPGFSGTVRFELTLDAEGRVKAVQMEGAPFDRVSDLEDWAYAWEFHPALLDGHPHACRMVYEVTW